MMNKNPKLLLIDQDGVLANFEKGVYDTWLAQYGTPLPKTPEQRQHFYFSHDFPTLQTQIYQIFSAKNFFANLPPMEGALSAIQKLLEFGHDVRICTAPIDAYQHCVSEKFAWVEQHLGSDWVKRIVLTKDKTWVRGDILIDDKPHITGSLTPTWQHWIYDAPYNRQIQNQTRITWTNQKLWQDLLL